MATFNFSITPGIEKVYKQIPKEYFHDNYKLFPWYALGEEYGKKAEIRAF